MENEALPAIRPQFLKTATDSLAYTLTTINETTQQGGQSRAILVVFVNGLGLPQMFWQPAIVRLQQIANQQKLGVNATMTLLTFDRQGQGLSQPPDGLPPQPHDLLASVQELHIMIARFLPAEDSSLFLVAHSIGVPLARLYIQHYPNTISSLLAIDSNMANSDFVSLFPNPRSPRFNLEQDLPSDTSLEQLIEALDRYMKMFHPSAVNPERLQRGNLASLLPYADRPRLQGVAKDNQVYLTVIGHDPETFAEESVKMSTKGLTQRYLEPVWQQYNRDLLEIGYSRGGNVVVAERSGHFVQRDRPDLVATEIWKMLLLLTE